MPQELGLKPWALDFTPGPGGNIDWPNQPHNGAGLQYPANHWDPALVAGLAAVEFAGQVAQWQGLDNQVGANELRRDGNTAAHQAVIQSGLTQIYQVKHDKLERYPPDLARPAHAPP